MTDGRSWRVFVAKHEPDLFDDESVGERVVVARGPDNEHPYVETVSFVILQPTFKRYFHKDKSTKELIKAVRMAYIADAADCRQAATWGDYFAAGNDRGCQQHFIREWGISPRWFASGLQHGLPTNWYDESLLISQGAVDKQHEVAAKAEISYARAVMRKMPEKTIRKWAQRVESAWQWLNKYESEHNPPVGPSQKYCSGSSGCNRIELFARGML